MNFEYPKHPWQLLKKLFLMSKVGKSIEREVVVEVLFKPEVYVAEVGSSIDFGSGSLTSIFRW